MWIAGKGRTTDNAICTACLRKEGDKSGEPNLSLSWRKGRTDKRRDETKQIHCATERPCLSPFLFRLLVLLALLRPHVCYTIAIFIAFLLPGGGGGGAGETKYTILPFFSRKETESLLCSALLCCWFLAPKIQHPPLSFLRKIRPTSAMPPLTLLSSPSRSALPRGNQALQWPLDRQSQSPSSFSGGLLSSSPPLPFLLCHLPSQERPFLPPPPPL